MMVDPRSRQISLSAGMVSLDSGSAQWDGQRDLDLRGCALHET